VLSGADYEAIATLFTVASDTDDVGRDAEPYVMYGAPPWIPQAAALQPLPGAADLIWPDASLDGEPAELDSDGYPVPGYQPTDHQDPDYRAPDNEGTGHQAADDEAAGYPAYREAAFRAPDHETGPANGQRAASAGYLAEGYPAGSAPAGSPAWASDHPSGPIQLAGPGSADSAGPLPAGRHAAAAHPLQVKILGPFTVSGAADQLQPKQAELVLALALAAPAGLSNSALCSLLGPDPDHAKPSDAVRQIITRTRRRLGLAPDGQEYIIHAGNGHYILHPGVSLDWSLFRQLVASGRADDLRAAVALISGQPFTGSYFWWIDIPLMETVRAELVDAAETLSEFELATGSARAAARAARAGLLAEASAEQLWRSVMRAEHAAGNLAGVTEAWRRCLDAIEDVAPGGEPHPDTETLYRQLTMASRQRAPVR
jgi:DNA-binding SARP family transcriptional activator